MTRVASFIVLVAIIVALGILFWRVMSSFFVPLFLSLLLVVIFRPLHLWLVGRLQGRARLAAGLTVAAVTLIVLLPAVWVASLAVGQAVHMVTRTDVVTVQQQLDKLRSTLGLQVPGVYGKFRAAAEELAELCSDTDSHPARVRNVRNLVEEIRIELRERGAAARRQPLEQVSASLQEALDAVDSEAADSELEHHAALDKAWAQLQEYRLVLLGGAAQAWLKETVNPTDERLRQWKSNGFQYARQWLLTISGPTLAIGAKLVLGGVIVVISLYFFLVDGPAMVKSVMWLSPLDDRHEEELLAEFSRVSRAVVVATLLSAVIQAVLASIGFAVAGLPSVFLLMLLTAVFAMIPFFGAAAVWVPASIYLYVVEDRLLAALLLAAYGALIVSTSDNIVKPWVLHGQSNLHPLLALLSVLGGVQALGPIGILIGPMVVAFLQTLLKILQRELLALDAQRRSATP